MTLFLNMILCKLSTNKKAADIALTVNTAQLRQCTFNERVGKREQLLAHSVDSHMLLPPWLAMLGTLMTLVSWIKLNS